VTWDLRFKKNNNRYTEIKGVGIPQSGQVILLTNKKLVLRRAQPFLLPREAIVAFLTVIL
jgi:hypothetical protein